MCRWKAQKPSSASDQKFDLSCQCQCECSCALFILLLASFFFNPSLSRDGTRFENGSTIIFYTRAIHSNVIQYSFNEYTLSHFRCFVFQTYYIGFRFVFQLRNSFTYCSVHIKRLKIQHSTMNNNGNPCDAFYCNFSPLDKKNSCRKTKKALKLHSQSIRTRLFWKL